MPWRRHSAETNSLYRNNGNGTFTEVTSDSIVSEAGFYGSCAWGDYDNDGFLDLFLGQLNPGQNNVLYHNNGDGTFTKVLEGSLVNDGGVSHASAWADYDNDGFLDLFVANTVTFPGGATYSNFRNFLYRNDGNTNQWIKLKLVGTVSNRAAIGAKVRVKATMGGNTVWQFRDISGGSGWGGGQNSLVAHFGLGDATNIDTIRIEWPSGIVQEMHNVAVKQFLTVTEPARLQALGARCFARPIVEGDGFRGTGVHRSEPVVAPNHRDQPDRHAGIHGSRCGEPLAAFLPNGASVIKSRKPCRLAVEKSASLGRDHECTDAH